MAAEPRTVAAPADLRAGTGPAARAGARLALALIDAYKLLISPYFSGSCRFLPSCADYAREAVILHGALRGTWLAARRLSRCQPLCAGGHDPVPVSSPWRRFIVAPETAMRQASRASAEVQGCLTNEGRPSFAKGYGAAPDGTLTRSNSGTAPRAAE